MSQSKIGKWDEWMAIPRQGGRKRKTCGLTATSMIVALRFIRRHSCRTDTTGSHISFSRPYSHLTRNTNRPSSHHIQTRPTPPSCTRTSCSMIIHYRNKNAGSWKISLAIPTIPTTQTRGCGHLTTRTRQETQRRRYVKRFFFAFT